MTQEMNQYFSRFHIQIMSDGANSMKSKRSSTTIADMMVQQNIVIKVNIEKVAGTCNWVVMELHVYCSI